MGDSDNGGADLAPPSRGPSLIARAEGSVLVMELNRPQVRNAIDEETAQGLAEAQDRLDSDPELVVGVLTGAGGCFSSGMDLAAFVDGKRPWDPERGFGGIVERPSRKPLIAAIEGFAVAGGLEIALACDLLVVAEDARLGIPEAKIGLVAAGGGVVRLARRLPYHVVMEMTLTGEALSAPRLHELGLVNELTAPGAALETAIALAEKIARNAPLALAASKELLEHQHDWSIGEIWDRQREVADRLLKSADAREGAYAFIEGREPRWSGR